MKVSSCAVALVFAVCAVLGAVAPAHAALSSQAAAPPSGAAALASISAALAPPAGTEETDGPLRVDAVEVELVAARDALVPGEPTLIGVRLRHDPQWHTYWRNPGDSGLPTQVDLELPPGFEAGAIRWPAPQRLFIAPLANYGYEGEIVLPIPLTVPATIAGSSARLTASVSWLVCREICIPGQARVALTLPISTDGTSRASPFAGLFDDAARRTPQRTIEALAAVRDGMLSLGLPGRPSKVEFFPYREGFVENAAEQVLYAIDDSAAGDSAAGPSPVGSRLEVRLNEQGVRQARDDDAALLEAASGVVVVDGTPLEVDARASRAALPVGVEVARIDGAASAPAATPSRGWLSGLLSNATDSPAARETGASVGTSRYAGATAPSALWIAALFGAIGGLILNLMPCVFPVIGLKVLGFARQAGQADGASRLGALAFAAGVVASFWVLAATLLALRAGGEAAGWGFQLQSPAFVAAMAMLFVAIGLNFSGVYEIGLAMTRLGNLDTGHHPRHPLLGSFGSGALAVLVATPCTAPFMGSAMGFTLAGSLLDAFVVFTSIALGMAAPYVLLGFFPQALRFLPRPGRWMETFRQALAFPMYATAAWLAWVLGQQAGIDAVFALAIGAVLLALAAWLVGRFVQAGADASPRASARPVASVLAVLAFAGGVWSAWPPSTQDSVSLSALGVPAASPASQSWQTSSEWQTWSAERVAAARAANRPVFVDFTAAWCVSCQVNKRLVLERDSIVEAMAERGVVRLHADWTNRDARITEELAKFGRNGVPLYLLYRPGESVPRVLPELLTTGIVREALAGLPLMHAAGL